MNNIANTMSSTSSLPNKKRKIDWNISISTGIKSETIPSFVVNKNNYEKKKRCDDHYYYETNTSTANYKPMNRRKRRRRRSNIDNVTDDFATPRTPWFGSRFVHWLLFEAIGFHFLHIGSLLDGQHSII